MADPRNDNRINVHHLQRTAETPLPPIRKKNSEILDRWNGFVCLRKRHCLLWQAKHFKTGGSTCDIDDAKKYFVFSQNPLFLDMWSDQN